MTFTIRARIRSEIDHRIRQRVKADMHQTFRNEEKRMKLCLTFKNPLIAQFKNRIERKTSDLGACSVEKQTDRGTYGIEWSDFSKVQMVREGKSYRSYAAYSFPKNH